MLSSEDLRYSLIFKTSKGSIYRVTKDGTSSRLKGENNQMKQQPLCEAIFFVAKEEFNRLSDMTLGFLHLDPLANQKIVTTSYKVGTHPIELNDVDSEEKVVYEKGDSFVVLKGTKIGDIYQPDTIFGSIHFGHPIIEILRNSG